MGCTQADGITFPEEMKACLNKEITTSMKSRIFNRVLKDYLAIVPGSRSWRKWNNRNHKWFIGKKKDNLPYGRAIVFSGRDKYLCGALFDANGKVYKDQTLNFKLGSTGKLTIGHMNDEGEFNQFCLRYLPCRRYRGIFLQQRQVPPGSYIQVSIPSLENDPRKTIKKIQENDLSRRDLDDDHWNTFFYYYPDPIMKNQQNIEQSTRKARDIVAGQMNALQMGKSQSNVMRKSMIGDELEAQQQDKEHKQHSVRFEGKKQAQNKNQIEGDPIDEENLPQFLRQPSMRNSIRTMTNLTPKQLKKQFVYCPTICPQNQSTPGEAGPFTYRGYMLNNEYHGRGQMKGLYNTYLGYYEKGQMKGRAQQINYLREIIYIGEFEKNKKNGEGVLYDFDENVILQGKWKNDRFQGQIK